MQDYHQNPRIFWITLGILVLIVIWVWPKANVKCSTFDNFHDWDSATLQMAANCTK